MHLRPQSRPQLPARRGTLRRLPAALAALALALIVLAACRGAAPPAGGTTMELSSTSFSNGQIPRAYTCDDADTSPQLAWSAPPANTRSFALTLTDPDAPSGTFTHWVLYNLPADTRSLPEGLAKDTQLPNGSLQGRNDFRRTGYGGPCPPRGSTHRYVFTLYALDAPLSLAPGASRDALESALKGHILAKAELTARYSR